VEQVALTVEIIKFHSGECECLNKFFTLSSLYSSVSDVAYPRVQILDNLIHVLRHQPNLRKETSSALVGLGEALSANANSTEVDALLRGTLCQEPYARNSCLQAIQV
jgi:hypothetical protein